MFRSIARQILGTKRKCRSYRPSIETLECRLVPTLSVPVYNSLLGAKASLYLDFDGDSTASWGAYSNITTPAYDTDGDPNSFSATELTNIYQIWQRVAEDYAPFNINVTTVEPASFADGVALRVAIGGDGAWTGGTYGGISYIDSFTTSIANVSFVFSVNLGNGTPSYVGDAISHEAGHAFGLQHQSVWTDSTLTAEYSSGPGDGTAPIMGSSYGMRSLWWYGTNDVSSTTFQDDMAVIASTTNGFGYRADDFGDSIATAGSLTVDSSGNISGGGLIRKMDDLDYFSFTTGAGTLSLTVSVPSGFNNLDAKLQLLDANGNVLATADPSDSFGATITYSATAGTYYLVVSSHGISSSATSTNYGQDVGTYTFSGSIIPAGASAPAAPSNLTATAASNSQINLAWTDNASNEDGFKIERLNSDGSWTQLATVGANVTSWSDTGLTGSTSYTYRVRAYNAAGGDSAYSNQASATTNADPAVPAAPSGLAATAKTKPTAKVTLTWTDNATDETGYKIERSTDGGVTWSLLTTLGANVTSYSDTSVSKGSTYSYRVYACNDVGNSAYSSTVTITVGSSGGGGGRKAAVPEFSEAVILASEDTKTSNNGGDAANGGTFTWMSAATLHRPSTTMSGSQDQADPPPSKVAGAFTDRFGVPVGNDEFVLAGAHSSSWASAAGFLSVRFDVLPDLKEAVIL